MRTRSYTRSGVRSSGDAGGSGSGNTNGGHAAPAKATPPPAAAATAIAVRRTRSRSRTHISTPSSGSGVARSERSLSQHFHALQAMCLGSRRGAANAPNVRHTAQSHAQQQQSQQQQQRSHHQSAAISSAAPLGAVAGVSGGATVTSASGTVTVSVHSHLVVTTSRAHSGSASSSDGKGRASPDGDSRTGSDADAVMGTASCKPKPTRNSERDASDAKKNVQPQPPPLQRPVLPIGAASASTSATNTHDVSGSTFSDTDGYSWTSHFPPFTDPQLKKTAEMFMATINAHAYGYPQITSITRIDTITNPALETAYNSKRAALEKQCSNAANEVLAFHGTPRETNIDSISRKNFDCSKLGQTTGNKGWYGSGIYLTAHAGAALRYQYWNTNSPPGRMLVCRAMLGRVFEVPENSVDYIGKGITAGYHSHRGRDRWDTDWQLVVFDNTQILPFAHIHYR